MKIRRMSLKKRLLISIISLTILGVGTYSLSIIYTATKSFSQTLREQLLQTTNMAQTQVKNWATNVRTDVKLQSERNVLKQALLTRSDANAIRLANDAFRAFGEGKKEYETMALVGLDGLVVASNDEASVGKLNVADREYFNRRFPRLSSFLPKFSFFFNGFRPRYFIPRLQTGIF